MSEWFCYESKAGIPFFRDGNRIETREGLREGMEVTFDDGLTGQRNGTVVKLGEELLVDCGSFWWRPVFEEGYWGHRGGFNHRAIKTERE